MRTTTRLSMFAIALAFAAPVHAQSANGAAPASVTSTIIDPVADAAPASAKSVETAAATSPADVRADKGATIAGVRAGVHTRETARPNQPTAAAATAHLGQARAMMIVGVAGLIVGGIIGGTPGTIIMVGGGVVGLLGLYNYMQ